MSHILIKIGPGPSPSAWGWPTSLEKPTDLMRGASGPTKAFMSGPATGIRSTFLHRFVPPSMDLRGRDFLEVTDFTSKELSGLIDLATRLKKEKRLRSDLAGKSLGMLFAKTSTRTRISFEVGMTQLGGHAISLRWDETNFVKGDIEDESRVMSRYCDGIMARLFRHDDMRRIANASDKPVINGMDDDHHPCQALADVMTIMEAKGHLDGVRIGWIGDPTNVFLSLAQAADLLGMDMVLAAPVGYDPKQETGAQVVRDPRKAAEEADVLVTDTWVSLGQEADKAKRMKDFKGYTIDTRILSLARPDAIVLHCMPAQRGYEIASEVMDSAQCLAFEEAENRLHTTKALLLSLL